MGLLMVLSHIKNPIFEPWPLVKSLLLIGSINVFDVYALKKRLVQTQSRPVTSHILPITTITTHYIRIKSFCPHEFPMKTPVKSLFDP
jgi:hypothetical protein